MAGKRGRTDAERFWEKVKKATDDGCWEWIGYLRTDGYGRFWTPSGAVNAHRWAWEAKNGAIGSALPLDHLCRNRACVNPDHLELVTTRENVRRGTAPAAVNARKTHCIRGHEFTPENTRYESGQRRRCLTCRRNQGDPNARMDSEPQGDRLVG